jgi:hypothetical protein
MSRMWNKLDYLTKRNGSGNKVVWNKVDCSTKCCRFVLYLVYNFLSVEGYRFYLKHMSLYDNLHKEMKIIPFVSVLNYAVNIRDNVWSSGCTIDWSERSGCVLLTVLFLDICRIRLTITTQIQKIVGAPPWTLTQHVLYTDIDHYDYSSLFYARFGLWPAL